MDCNFSFVSRNPTSTQLSYETLDEALMNEVDLIVNTTPLGTFPAVEKAPPLPYQWINKKHLLFDLIYNPMETAFMKLCESK